MAIVSLALGFVPMVLVMSRSKTRARSRFVESFAAKKSKTNGVILNNRQSWSFLFAKQLDKRNSWY